MNIAEFEVGQKIRFDDPVTGDILRAMKRSGTNIGTVTKVVARGGEERHYRVFFDFNGYEGRWFSSGTEDYEGVNLAHNPVIIKGEEYI